MLPRHYPRTSTPLPDTSISPPTNPLDVRNPDDMTWLETLVWPDQPERLARLRAAIQVARTDPPRIVAGDLLTSLPSLAAEAPKDATLVVFHTAVLAYVADP